jgi:translin
VCKRRPMEERVADLEEIFSHINSSFDQINAIRDQTLARSRSLIRFCATSIRATHRHDYEEARRLLAEAEQVMRQIKQDSKGHPEIYYAGYTQDALKEYAEAHLTLAFVSGSDIPTPEELEVAYAPYANGLAEASGELRRFILDGLRSGDIQTGEQLLKMMDDIYTQLITVDFPDAITQGLRRNTDLVRGVLERTRGDLTTAVRQEAMTAKLQALEDRLDAQEG